MSVSGARAHLVQRDGRLVRPAPRDIPDRVSAAAQQHRRQAEALDVADAPAAAGAAATAAVRDAVAAGERQRKRKWGASRVAIMTIVMLTMATGGWRSLALTRRACSPSAAAATGGVASTHSPCPFSVRLKHPRRSPVNESAPHCSTTAPGLQFAAKWTVQRQRQQSRGELEGEGGNPASTGDHSRDDARDRDGAQAMTTTHR